MNNFLKMLHNAKKASYSLAAANGLVRKRAILDFANLLEANTKKVLEANLTDIKDFRGDLAMRDRLKLSQAKIKSIANNLRQVAILPDPLNRTLDTRRRPNGLVISRTSVPLGVVAVIYESRPNVTADLFALALKTGNAIVLKGGKESFHSNKAIIALAHQAMKRGNLPVAGVLLVEPGDAWKDVLFSAFGLVDVIIPRGGKSLIEYVRRHSRIPVIETGAGVCHVLVDQKYNGDKAASIIVNSKIQAPSVCNALDTLVLHERASQKLLPKLAPLLAEHGVEIFADRKAFNILKKYYPAKWLKQAKQRHFGHEFLSLKLAIKTVSSFQLGLAFVANHTSGHTEAVLTEDNKNIALFLDKVDAAVVIANASTRFTDGGEFGMGAEVGISTQKLHARGPMGLEALTTYKWRVHGKGQIRN